jgi:hypothetical protein
VKFTIRPLPGAPAEPPGELRGEQEDRAGVYREMAVELIGRRVQYASLAGANVHVDERGEGSHGLLCEIEHARRCSAFGEVVLVPGRQRAFAEKRCRRLRLRSPCLGLVVGPVSRGGDGPAVASERAHDCGADSIKTADPCDRAAGISRA